MAVYYTQWRSYRGSLVPLFMVTNSVPHREAFYRRMNVGKAGGDTGSVWSALWILEPALFSRLSLALLRTALSNRCANTLSIFVHSFFTMTDAWVDGSWMDRGWIVDG